MTTKEIVMDTLRRAGLAEAQKLRTRAASGDADGSEIIKNAHFVPDYPPDGKRNFINVPVGAPYRYNGQIYKLWQQHDANGNPDWTPDKAVSLWDICHTKNISDALPYAVPQGTRGLYQSGEVMVWTDGNLYRSKNDGNAYTPETYPDAWELIYA